MHIKNKRLLDFFLKYNIDYENILLKVVDIIEPIIKDEKHEINYNLLLESFTNEIKQNITDNNRKISDEIGVINTNLSEYINFIKVSSNKGKVKENTYFHMMSQTFPNYEIEDCSTLPNSMDICLKINNLSIRIDIKDYNSNVPLKEITKFHSDIISNKCHGILISDKTSISNKDNFTFDLIQDKYIAFYISKNNLDMNSIKNCIAFIKTIHSYILSNDDKVFFHKKIIEKISIMINDYSNNIRELKKSLQDCINMTNKLTMDNLSNLLNISLNTSILTTSFICEHCSTSFDTLRKKDNHYKKCKEKNIKKEKMVEKLIYKCHEEEKHLDTFDSIIEEEPIKIDNEEELFNLITGKPNQKLIEELNNIN